MSADRGFTLIELLVGAAMAGILAAAGISLSSHIHNHQRMILVPCKESVELILYLIC